VIPLSQARLNADMEGESYGARTGPAIVIRAAMVTLLDGGLQIIGENEAR
jgi:hypothetical protein